LEENTDNPGADARVVPFTRLIALEPSDAGRLASLIGPVDQNLKHLERRLGVYIRSRGNEFQISGPQGRVQAAEALLHQLYRETADRESIEPDFVHLFLQEAGLDALMAEQDKPQGPTVVMDVDAQKAETTGKGEKGAAQNVDQLVIRTPKKSIKPRGGNQLKYCNAVRRHDINFGIGPAGTGKTYLAVALAVEALESQQFREYYWLDQQWGREN